MSPWVFRIWRLGWARDSYLAIGGYRQLFWRLWWDLRVPMPEGRTATHTLDVDALFIPNTPLHWRPTGWQYVNHYCGSEPVSRWTSILDSVTCLACKHMAEPARIQYLISNR